MDILNCGQIDEGYVGKEVGVFGWCRLVRDHGKKLFIDLADRHGTTQLVFEGAAKTRAEGFGREYVISAFGTVKKREEDTVDKTNKTGRVEISVKEAEQISASKTPPFELISEKGKFLADEELRLKYRYLDLRRQESIQNILLRDRITKAIRRSLWEKDFLELETPVLIKDTYETGSRTFLVPSRIHKESFYALQQSPQLFKQMCMIGGLGSYFQIARCFRDEDPREERQPEFTQVDIEVSFKDEAYVQSVVEDVLSSVFKEALGRSIQLPLKHMTYHEAFERYGSDKPDLRFGSELIDLTESLRGCDYKILKRVIENGGAVRAAAFTAGYGKPGSMINERYMLEVVELAKGFGLGGLTWLYMEGDQMRSEPQSIADALKPCRHEIVSRLNAADGYLIVIGADLSRNVLLEGLGKTRRVIGNRIGAFNEEFSFVWIDRFPEFERDEVTGALKPAHNPFTAPTNDTIGYLDTAPEMTIGRQYDLVLNGYEIGSGSIRINDPELQTKILRKIGMSNDAIEKNFGFLIEALSYGAPVHGGIALGLDRLVALLAKKENIREFILFPKNKKQELLVDGAPTRISRDRLDKDYGIRHEEGAQ
jgi:aspartyl-tRNA synthetase